MIFCLDNWVHFTASAMSGGNATLQEILVQNVSCVYNVAGCPSLR